MTGATRLLLRLDIGADDADRTTFEAAWTRLADAAGRQPGHRGDTLGRDLTVAGRYWITTDWQTAADLAAFSAGPEHERFRQVIAELVTDRSVHRAEVVGEVRAGSAVGR